MFLSKVGRDSVEPIHRNQLNPLAPRPMDEGYGIVADDRVCGRWLFSLLVADPGIVATRVPGWSSCFSSRAERGDFAIRGCGNLHRVCRGVVGSGSPALVRASD